MIRKLACLMVAIGLALPAWAAEKPGSISGYVSSAKGVPQMGALVEVLGSALHTIRVFTDERGFYSAGDLLPGVYNIKVSAPSFLPTLRESVGLDAGASLVLNLRLNSLFESLQFAGSRQG
jgi:hypothetical protein